MDGLPDQRRSLRGGSQWGAFINQPAPGHRPDLRRPSQKILKKHPYSRNLRPTSTTAFGLIAWLEQTLIHLPLKAIECRFDVSGAAVDVQIDQIFHQSAGRPLDVTYSFPLPSKAAAYRCEMI